MNELGDRVEKYTEKNGAMEGNVKMQINIKITNKLHRGALATIQEHEREGGRVGQDIQYMCIYENPQS